MQLLKNKYFCLAVMLAVLTSCKTTKDIQKTKTEKTTSTQTKAVETATVTETFTTPVTVLQASISGSAPVNNLLSGDSIFEETPELKIVTKIDKSGRVHTKAIKKAQKVPIPGTRVTVSKKESDTTTKSKKVAKVKEKQVKREGLNFNYLWWLLLLIPVWIYRKKLF